MEFTVIGDAVNRTARYTAAAVGDQVLISPDVHERVWRLVEAEATTIATKHEGGLPAYKVLGLKAGRQSGATSSA
jgi:class 3 adenylate cyclase